jgi:hypothetical protein
MISLRSVRGAAAGAVGTGALAGAIAMVFGGIPAAQAAPAPAPATSFETAGPHGGAPLGPGGGHGGGWGHGGPGHGGWGNGGGFWGPGGWWNPGHWWKWW